MGNPRPRLRDRILPGLIGLLGPQLLRAMGATWRIRRSGLHPARLRKDGATGRYIIAFWHQMLLPLTYAHRSEGATVLVSRHGDGELIARILLALGYEVARGSSTRGGARALRELLEYAASKSGDIGITPDGPKGPARKAHTGCVYLAARSGLPLLPLAAVNDSAWSLRSWDRFQIPKPFTRIAIATANPITVPSDVPASALDSYVAELEAGMRTAEQTARELLDRSW